MVTLQMGGKPSLLCLDWYNCNGPWNPGSHWITFLEDEEHLCKTVENLYETPCPSVEISLVWPFVALFGNTLGFAIMLSRYWPVCSRNLTLKNISWRFERKFWLSVKNILISSLGHLILAWYSTTTSNSLWVLRKLIQCWHGFQPRSLHILKSN